MNPTITIIIAMYNAEDTIERCIKSVLSQSYDDYEVLIINDGSTDQSKRIIEEYMVKSQKIRLETIENHGVAYARQLGYELSRGEYIYYVDSDDWIEDTTLQILYENMKSSGCKISGCGYNVENQPHRLTKASREIMATDDIVKYYFRGQYKGALWSYLFNKTIFEEFQFPLEIYSGEDSCALFYAFKTVDQLVMTGDCLYHYTLNPNGLTEKPIYNERKRNTYYHNKNMMKERIEYWPKYKNDILSSFIIRDLAIVTSMCKSDRPTYEWEIINDVQKRIRNNFLVYMSSHSILPVFKISMFIFAISKYVFLNAYRIAYRIFFACFHVNMHKTVLKRKAIDE